MIEITAAEAHCYGIDISRIGEQLFFVVGGKLIERVWQPPADADEGAVLPLSSEGRYLYQEISPAEAPNYAYTLVELGLGVKMVDIYKFILANRTFQGFAGRYAIEHSQRGIDKFVPADQLDGDIEYMEIYHLGTLAEDSDWFEDDSEIVKPLPKLEGVTFPCFHGVGPVLQADLPDDQGGYKKGDRIHWGLMGSTCDKFADLPLVLNTTLKIYDERSSTFIPPIKPIMEVTCHYTLLDMLKAIFWELSWFGDPHATDELEPDDI
jgi:hypothetical protein